MSQLIRALVVDDSAFARKMIREMLSRSPFIEVVGAARDGNEALKMVSDLQPDVVTCDLMMPNCDGLTFVRRQMERHPLPIVLLTATPEDGKTAVEAMDAGALEIVQKPTARASRELLDIHSELIQKVKAAALVHNAQPARLPEKIESSAPPPGRSALHKFDIVAIGLSTGGPQAIRGIMEAMPADFPVPIAIVVHMPVGYTAWLAEKLNAVSALSVCEARDGEIFLPGKAIVARAGKHLRFRRMPDGSVTAALSARPFDIPHRPSVDVLFESAAETYGPRVLGVVMTGMGSDGTKGAAWIKAQGGVILTEAEESCVVYGMPRSVVEAGLSDASAPLSEIPHAIVKRI